MRVVRLSFDDRDDLSFGDDVVEFDQDCLDFPAVVEVTGISIFMASTNAISSPSPTLPPACDGKRADATGDFGDDLDLWHATLRDRLTDYLSRERLFVIFASNLGGHCKAQRFYLDDRDEPGPRR